MDYLDGSSPSPTRPSPTGLSERRTDASPFYWATDHQAKAVPLAATGLTLRGLTSLAPLPPTAHLTAASGQPFVSLKFQLPSRKGPHYVPFCGAFWRHSRWTEGGKGVHAFPSISDRSLGNLFQTFLTMPNGQKYPASRPCLTARITTSSPS